MWNKQGKLDELCFKCTKKPLKGLESVMNRLGGKHRTNTSSGETSLVQAREVGNLDQSCSSGAGSWIYSGDTDNGTMD